MLSSSDFDPFRTSALEKSEVARQAPPWPTMERCAKQIDYKNIRYPAVSRRIPSTKRGRLRINPILIGNAARAANSSVTYVANCLAHRPSYAVSRTRELRDLSDNRQPCLAQE
jgi:hypothetical protein